MEKSLSLVIPCLNEEAAIPSVLRAVAEVRHHFLTELQFQDVQVIVVDDASQDRSVAALKDFPFVEIHRNSQTLGYGASLRHGFSKARGQWICFFDMDNSYPAHHIPSMWDLLVSKDLDIVLGSRAFDARGMSLTRGLGNWFFSLLTKVFLRTSVRDVCSGFRIFRRQCLPEILKISENTLGYSLEMSIHLSSLGWKMKEYNIEYQPRKGVSKLSVWKDGWQFLFLILSAAYRKRVQVKELRP